MRAFLICLMIPILLAGCGAKKEWASDELVTRMAYREPGPAKLTLMTMINNRSGSGAHTALMINASQRVIWDPAGSFENPRIPERNDLIYGVNPEVANLYKSMHARETYHVVIQEVLVAPEVAEKAFRLAQTMGPISDAQCAMSTSALLRQLPGFESINSQWFPKKLMADFAKIPGVTTDKLYENDDGDIAAAVKAAAAKNVAPAN